MKNKIGIFIDTFKISGGAYQELSYLSAAYKNIIKLII